MVISSTYFVFIQLASVEDRPRVRGSNRERSINGFCAVEGVEDAPDEWIFDSPPDSPRGSRAHSPSPESNSDSECVDLQEACNSFHRTMGEMIDNLNSQTGNKYQFSPPPTPPRFGSPERELKDDEEPTQKIENRQEVSTGRRLLRIFPYIMIFLIFQGIFLSCVTTPAGVTMIGMLFSMLGMLLVPIIYLVNNVSFTDFFMGFLRNTAAT